MSPGTASGELDLARMLATLETDMRPDAYVYAAIPAEQAAAWAGTAAATVHEDEALTVVVRKTQAEQAGLAYEFPAAWISLKVHSSLEAVGLTAAVSVTLKDAGISCNVLAGFYHDHLLVPWNDRVRALRALSDLAARASRGEI